MGSATNKIIPVDAVVKMFPHSIPKAIMWWRKSGDIEPELSRHEGNEDFLSKLAAQIHAVSRAIKRRGKIVEENDVKLSNQLPPNP